MSEARQTVGRARGLVAIGRYAEALELLEPALASEESGFEARCLASQCQLELGRHDEAVKLAEWALYLRPESDWPHRLAAIAHLRRGRAGRADALTHAAAAARLAPAQPEALHALVLAQLANRQRRAAAETAAAALEQHPGNATAHISLANVCQARRDWKGTEKALRAALAIDPHDAELSLALGRVLERKGPLRHASAGEAYAAAGRADPASDAPRRGILSLGPTNNLKAMLWLLGVGRSFALAQPIEVAGAIGAVTLGVALLSALLRMNATRRVPEGVRRGLRRDYEVEALGWLGLAGLVAALIAVWAAGVPASEGGGRVVAAGLAGFAAAALWLGRPGLAYALRTPARWLRRLPRVRA